MNTLAIKTGSEGPAQDPYSYTNVTFTNLKGETAMYHGGLGDYTEFADRTVHNEQAFPAFCEFMGLSENTVKRLIQKKEEEMYSAEDQHYFNCI